jgi:hypothetical protein
MRMRCHGEQEAWSECEQRSGELTSLEGSVIGVGDNNIRRCGTKGFTAAVMLMQPYARGPRVLQG